MFIAVGGFLSQHCCEENKKGLFTMHGIENIVNELIELIVNEMMLDVTILTDFAKNTLIAP